MKLIRRITLIARLAFMATMLLGLVSWVAHIFFLNVLLNVLAQIHFTSIHEGVGVIGVLALLTLSVMAVFEREMRLLGVGAIIYALVVPAFGLTQQLLLVGNQHWLIQVAHLLVGIGAMVLLFWIEKRYQYLKLKEQGK